MVLKEKIKVVIDSPPSSSGALSSTYARFVSRSYSAHCNMNIISPPKANEPRPNVAGPTEALGSLSGDETRKSSSHGA